MKKSLKGFMLGFLISSIIFSSIGVFADNQTLNAFFNNIKVSINGKQVDLKDAKNNPIEPFIVNGTTYLPVRILAESLGMEVKFNETTNTVELTRKEEKVLSEATRNNVASVTETTTDKITYRRDKNNLMVVTQQGVDYVSIDDIESYVLTKYNDNYNTYFLKYDEVTNTAYLSHYIRDNKPTAEEIEKGIVSQDRSKTEIILKDIPTFKIKTNGIRIQYNYYVNNILPIFNKESSN